jgi:hypothetical protein
VTDGDEKLPVRIHGLNGLASGINKRKIKDK